MYSSIFFKKTKFLLFYGIARVGSVSTQLAYRKFMGSFWSFFIGVHFVQTRSVSTRSIFLIFFSSESILKTKNTCFDLIRFASRVFLFLPRISTDHVMLRSDKRPNTYFFIACAFPFCSLFSVGVSSSCKTIPFLFTRISQLSKKLNEGYNLIFIIRIKSD